jgi:hypothetical protein
MIENKKRVELVVERCVNNGWKLDQWNMGELETNEWETKDNLVEWMQMVDK